MFASRLARAAVAAPPRSFLARNFASVGDKLPSVDLHLGFPPKKHNLADFAKDKSILLVGLPGGESLFCFGLCVHGFLAIDVECTSPQLTSCLSIAIPQPSLQRGKSKDTFLSDNRTLVLSSNFLTSAESFSVRHPDPQSRFPTISKTKTHFEKKESTRSLSIVSMMLPSCRLGARTKRLACPCCS